MAPDKLDAEATIKQFIFTTLIDNTPITNSGLRKVSEEIFDNVFKQDTIKWAIEEWIKPD